MTRPMHLSDLDKLESIGSKKVTRVNTSGPMPLETEVRVYRDKTHLYEVDLKNSEYRAKKKESGEWSQWTPIDQTKK